MKILNEPSAIHSDTVVTIGKFEGLHRGHRHLLETVILQAKARNMASVLLSFVPHPAKILWDKNYKPLFTQEEQAFLLGKIPAPDYWLAQKFDREFAKQTPQEFCDFLYTNFRCRVLVIGKNFRFGYERKGTPETLQAWGQAMGVNVVIVPNVNLSERPVSSSAIRAALAEGDTEAAAAALGQPFFMLGTVQEGAKLGRTLGFPTVNLHPSTEKFLPKNGVYLTTTHIGAQSYKSLTNLGNSPTINSAAPTKAETHILGYNGDLYNQQIMIEFNEFLRPQKAFASVEELKAQIMEDVKESRK